MTTATARPVVPYNASVLKMGLSVQRQGMLGFFEQLWREQGDLIRMDIGKTRMFLVIHPDDIAQISAGQGTIYDKAASYDKTRELLLGNGLITSTGALWRRQRKLMAPFFTPRAVEAYLPLISQEGQRFLQRWEQLAQQGTGVDMLTEMMVLTARITLRSLFSTQSEAELLEIKDAVETMIRYVASSQFRLLALPLWVPIPENRAYLRARSLVQRYVSGLINQRRAMPIEQWPDDLLSALMRARDDEANEMMSDALLYDEAVTLYFAGYETTARTLAFFWYALAQNPAVAAEVQAEVRQLSTDVPALAELRQLSYTGQAIKETLRLYPSAPIFVRDAVQEDQIGGVRVPVGTRMMLFPYLTHRHREFWPNPERFDPQRFSRENEATRHQYAFIPFATGQRICLGSHFALFEALTLASMLARHFAPRLQPGYQPQWWSDGTLTLKNGLPMQITRTR